MNPRIAEAMKAEAMKAIPERLDRIEATLAELLALARAAAARPEPAQRPLSPQPARR